MAKYRRQWFWGVSIPIKTIWNFIGIIILTIVYMLGGHKTSDTPNTPPQTVHQAAPMDALKSWETD